MTSKNDDADKRAKATARSMRFSCHEDFVNAQNAIANAIRAAVAEALQLQLPPEMQTCTIVYKTCEKGHGWLTATNWVQHGCPHCAIEGRDKILTDLLCNDTERGEEMWQLGAEAMREAMREAICRVVYDVDDNMEASNMPIPQPPSQSATGEVLQPSRLRLKAEKMETALREILQVKMIRRDSRDIAREALEEANEQS